ncbi:MAG: ABC transporter permease, partial [Verrucomicrobiae bacterium]|nr:ABC transporter permease [Verrucomicrobiae bacterium]
MKLALRQLLKNPGFTALAVLTLALGIGANTAIFSVINGVLLRPLPYPEPDRLVHIASVNPELGMADARSSDPNIADWQDRSTLFEEIAAFQEWDGALTIAGESETVRVNWVTPNLLGLLGIQAAQGRPLSADDMDSGIMVPYSIWQRRFAGDANAVGLQIQSDGDSATIVGVLPPDA